MDKRKNTTVSIDYETLDKIRELREKMNEVLYPFQLSTGGVIRALADFLDKKENWERFVEDKKNGT